ncbi:MAG: recombinase family protein [Sphaerochaetaceae bacterium]|jgi:DNA invertase Pin-like site-specific DNA recombinase|nr:recombinase family protein [Sphaerochaetaceae bacterium]MDD3941041.1 recombinase family protein [Sphaerochaetaceae bacterium]MDX9940278.1 recombinase family protein [Sphaerochaetaceae bacterium]
MPKVTKIDRTITSLPVKKRVAAYARVSVDSDELMQSLAAQVSHYSTHIQSNPHWEYAGVYADAGISGTATKNRSEFQRLIADCEKGMVDIILTKSISRFARNTVDLLKTVRSLREHNISVRFEREHIDSLTGDGELMLSILASYAQEESLSISENVKWGIRKRFSQGRFLAYNIYGYRWIDDHYEIVEEEAEAIRFMYRSFADGMMLTEISEALAKQGIYNRKGKPFGKTSILRILDQEKYRGFSILQRTYVDDHITHRKQMNRGELPKFEVQGTHPVIIDEQLHQKVEAERERRRRSGAVRWRRATCFTRKIICAYCGSTFTYTPYSRTGELTQFQQGHYQCSHKRKHGSKSCPSKSLPVYTLRQVCGSAIGPLAGATPEDPFEEIWIDERVQHIVAFADRLEFHLKSSEVLTIPWKNTAKRDAWAYRKALAQQNSENSEVPS